MVGNKHSGWLSGVIKLVLATHLLAFCGESFGAQPLPPSAISEREIQRQQEQERQRLREIQDAQPDVRLQPEMPAEIPADYPPDESPCFLIRELRLHGEQSEKFQWALEPAQDAIGRCLGTQGVNVAMARVQDALVKKGFTTTRIVAEGQNLKEGILLLKLVPGVITDIALSADSGRHQRLSAVVPVRKGRILQIRDLEQGLENLRRIPSVQTDIKLIPGASEGESRLEIVRKQGRPVRVTLSADDAGSKYTGKYQGTAALHLDNMLGMSDMFSASIGSSVETRKRSYGTQNYSLYYSIPWTFWQLSFFHSNHDYHQKVAGYVSEYEYKGKTQNTSVELSRVLFRSGKGKTSASVGGWLSTSSNYLNDTELEIQRRRMAGWEFGVAHRHFFGSAVFDADFRYKRGTGALRARRAAEEARGLGTSRPSILSMNLRLNVPFKLKSQHFRFSTSWRQQWAFNRLIQKDRLSLGGRYTVRGYDGEYTLSGDTGFVSRSEFAYSLPKIKHEVYTAFDAGRVWGAGSDMLAGQSLSGAALGLRGTFKNVSYDGFVSTPVKKPARYPGKRWIWGFSTNIQF